MLKLKSLFCLSLLVLPVVIANANTTLTQRILKPVIQYQCEREVDHSKIWKITTYLMNEENKKKLKLETCDCVSNHALKDIPAQELAKATVNEYIKQEVIRKAMLNSLKACVISSKSHSEI